MERAFCTLPESSLLPYRAMPRFDRYVAIGDSTVEGLDDPDDRGGHRGWADRLAARIAAEQGSVLYANLGVRGRTTRQVRDEQLAPALAMRPDLAIVVSGTNDLLRRRYEAESLRENIEAMQRALVDGGATVLTFTLPDLSGIMPVARLVRRRLLVMNQVIRDACGATGAICCDLAAHPVAADPRLWSDDRLHANSAGHARIASALAHGLGLPGSDMTWADPLPGDPPRGVIQFARSEARWIRTHLAPWLWRHAHGRSSGDGIIPKRPQLMRFDAER
jgi:lysophospholipase L1-like esterase